MSLAAPQDIVAALRDFGLVVIEDDGWVQRGTGRTFVPFAQAWHHDAMGENVSDERALQVVRSGRSDLKGPLCNGWIDSDSRVFLIAYGNANHAGWNEADVLDRLRAGLAPLGDARDDPDGDTVVGNSHLWGWECRNAGDGIDVWEQLDAMERAGAALCQANGWPPAANAGHKELTHRKIDPRGFDMHAFRADIARILQAKTTPEEDVMKPQRIYNLTDGKVIVPHLVQDGGIAAHPLTDHQVGIWLSWGAIDNRKDTFEAGMFHVTDGPLKSQ